MQRGDRILSVEGEPIGNWTDLSLALSDAMQARKPTPLVVRDPNGHTRTRVLHFEQLPAGLGDEAQVERVGLSPSQQAIPPVVGTIKPGSGAAVAGLQPGDRIVSVDGKSIHDWNDLSDAVRGSGASGKPLALNVQRKGRTLALPVVPQLMALPDGSHNYVIGISPEATEAHYDTVLRLGPVAAIPAAFAQTWDLTSRTVAMLGQMLVGDASLRNISGPISIAQYANASADRGPAWFMWFLGIVSLSLGVMNLLPIPILDGGHLLYYLIELVKGSPLSERAMIAGQYVGVALLVGLMGLAFYNDILRLVS